MSKMPAAERKLPCPPADFFEPQRIADFKQNVFDVMGYVPDEWQAIFHASTARTRILACGVRVGKTFAVTPEAVSAALLPSRKSLVAGEYVGSRVWVCAPTYDLCDRLFLPTVRALKRHFPGFITSYSERERIVRLIGDGVVQGKSTDNPDSLVGEELDAAIVDEAPRIREHDKEQIKQRLATRDGWIVAIGSPVPSKWFKREFSLGRASGYDYHFEGDPEPGFRYLGRRVVFDKGTGEAGDYWSIRVPTHANRRIQRGILGDLEKSPERTFRQDLLAEFMDADGLVFPKFEHLATAKRLYAGLPGRRYCVGWDVARARDYSVVSVLDAESREHVFQDRFQGPWQTQFHRVASICRRFNQPRVLLDSTGKGDVVLSDMLHFNRHGRPEVEDVLGIEPSFASVIEGYEIHSNGPKRDIVESLQVAFDHESIRILDEHTLLSELRVFEYTQSELTGVIRYGAPPGFHDDTVLALALAWWCSSRPKGTTQFFM